MDILKAGFRNPWHTALFYLGIVVFVLLALFPIYYVFKMSIVSRDEVFSIPPKILPRDVTVDNYNTIFADTVFISSIRNSVVVAGLTTVLCLLIGSVAAFAIARIRFWLATPVLAFVLTIAFFPQVAILGPLFQQFQSWGIINTYQSLIIPDVLFALPLTVYLLVAYFRELPADLEEAAKVDGATTWQAFRKVTVPLSLPGVVTTGILTFIFAWSEFLFANTFAFDETTQPATVVIPQFATTYTTDYGAQAAAAIVVTIPLVLMVLFFQRRIVSGLTAGAVK